MRFQEYVARPCRKGVERRKRSCTEEEEGKEEHTRGGWRKTEIARVCGRSGIIYGATCKVRKITPASAGFAETTLVYATDPSGRTVRFREPENGRCLRVFQPDYVLRSFSTTNNLNHVQGLSPLLSSVRDFLYKQNVHS